MTATINTQRWPARAWWLLAGVVCAPLLMAAIVLAQRTWHPVLDMAMTELRVRDVGTRDTPLIGLPGRIGVFPDQGSHPGPWSFYLIAPIYRLAGASAYGMQLASVVLNITAATLVLWTVQRRGRLAVTFATAAVLALAVRGYGLEVLTHPWNPYFPLLLWLLVLTSTWGVLEGDRWLILFVVGAGSVAAQTHVPYLLPCIALNALALGVLARRSARTAGPDRTALLSGFGLGAVLWVAPFLDQLIRDPGNISRLLDHFTGTPPEDPIGVSGGTRVFLRHLDLPRAMARLLREDSALLDLSGIAPGFSVGGLVMLALWLGAVVVAWRIGHRSLLHLHTVVAVALLVGWLSMTRIFGLVWFYLTLWAWGTALMAAMATAWTAAAWWRRRRSGSGQVLPTTIAASAVLLLGATVLSVLAAPSLQVPERQLSDAVGEAIEPTVTALDAGVGAAIGKDGTYVVFWQDAAFIGSPGYGLLNELERRGYDVGVHPTWGVRVGEHRVLRPEEIDAEVHLVTGAFIDEWRQRDGLIEVATVDQRTPEERARFEELQSQVIARLEQVGRSDVVPSVTENLFGAMLTPGLPRDIVSDMEEMHALFPPMAVFIAPPGSSF